MKRSQVLLGTFVEIWIEDSIETTVSQKEFYYEICNIAFKEMAMVQQLMSVHEANSDISRINTIHHVPTPQVIQIHPWTYEVLLISKKLSEMTLGLFDCGLRGHSKKSSISSIQEVEFEEGNTIKISKPIYINLGGIAKGYAVDRGIEILKSFGIEQAVINAGGDLRVLGSAYQKIYLQESKSKNAFVFLGDLKDGAIATSSSFFGGNAIQSPISKIIHPKTGQEVDNYLSFSIVAPTCVIADGLTKALAIQKDIHAPYFKNLKAVPIIVE
jgi:thiamine biosynthesis lipoprotein